MLTSLLLSTHVTLNNAPRLKIVCLNTPNSGKPGSIIVTVPEADADMLRKAMWETGACKFER